MQEETEWNRLVDACRPNRSKESILLQKKKNKKKNKIKKYLK